MKFLFYWPILGGLLIAAMACHGVSLKEDGYHVFPGDVIQDAIEQAAANTTNKVVKVHAGVYRPRSAGQALIWFNRAHDGIRLEAVGPVTLTAANPEVAIPGAQGYPAIVNHVVYFGVGITSNTVLSGFRITGANNFVTDKWPEQIEPDITLPKNTFFFTDGGGIKIFGHSFPVIQNVEITDNYSSPCGAGISIQQQGFNKYPVLIRNTVLIRNRAQVTGSAIDLLAGSSARIVNCLLVSNVSNTGIDIVAKMAGGGTTFSNSGVLTVFWHSCAVLQNCTFTANRNALDDMGGLSTFENCIFADNLLGGGLTETERYELYLQAGAKVSGCLIRGAVLDPSHSVNETNNVLNAPPPRFNGQFVAEAAEYRGAGYRPAPAAPR